MRYTRKRHYEWTNDIAYLIGLMASDGCLISDGRHLDMTSADVEQLNNFLKALGRNIKISEKKNKNVRTAYRVQFSDVALYDFLLEVGLTPNKSKTIRQLTVPDVYFRDCLRGFYDGDGSSNAFWDKRWRSSYMFYVRFSSASRNFLEYLSRTNTRLARTDSGSIAKGNRGYTLNYAKADSYKLYEYMYYTRDVISLTRKRKKLEGFIEKSKAGKITKLSASGGIGRRATLRG